MLKTILVAITLLVCNGASAASGWRYVDGTATAASSSTPSVRFTVACEYRSSPVFVNPLPVVKVTLQTPPLATEPHIADAPLVPAVIQVGLQKERVNIQTSTGSIGSDSLNVARLLSTKGELTVYFDALFLEDDGRYVEGVSAFSSDYYVPVQFANRDRRKATSQVLRQCQRE